MALVQIFIKIKIISWKLIKKLDSEQELIKMKKFGQLKCYRFSPTFIFAIC